MYPPKTLRLAAVFAALALVPAARAQSIVDEWTLETKQHIFSIAVSPDGKTLAAANDNIHLYDLTVGPEPRQKTVIEARMFVGCRGVIFSPDSKRLAYGGSDNKVHLWSVDGEPKELSVGKSHAGDVHSLSFSRDGKMLASGASDKTVILWNINDAGKLIEHLVIKQNDKYDGPISSVAFTGPSQLIVANSRGAVRILNLTKDGKYREAAVSKYRDEGHSPMVAVKPDGRTFAVTFKNAIELAGATKGILVGNVKDVTGVACSPDGLMIASCAQDGRICVWSGTTPNPKIVKERPDALTCIAFTQPSADKAAADTFLAAGANTGKVFLYKVAPPETKKK